MSKEILMEVRTRDSKKEYFNTAGGWWLPRLIIWVDKDDNDEPDPKWGEILGESIAGFIKSNSLGLIAFQKREKGFWDMITHNKFAYDVVNTDPGSSYINYRQSAGHEVVTFLLYDKPLTGDIINTIRLTGSPLNRQNLLVHGVAMFEFGIEEAVMEICFAGLDETFMQILEETAKGRDYNLVNTDRHFLSDWVRVNPGQWRAKERFGMKWAEF